MALINNIFLKTVVLIEEEISEDKFHTVATGFLIGFRANYDEKLKEQLYDTFLITNRHVFSNYDKLFFRFDCKDGLPKRFPVTLIDKGKRTWLAHNDTNVDLAMMTINFQFLNNENVEAFYIEEDRFIYSENFKEAGISLGDGIFLLGFPVSISGFNQNYAIVRSGTLARIDEEIISSNKVFLADALVFPGNSGGPVLTKPTSESVDGTKTITSTYLIGVVSGYINYQEPLYSHQSIPNNISGYSVNNSGLATIVPMNFAKDIYSEFIKQNKILEEPSPSPEIPPENKK